MSKALIVVDGKQYMNTKTAADLWNLSRNTVAKYCKENRIINKFKSPNGWYIWTKEIRPLTSDEIHKLLVLTLQLKNKPSLEVDWSTFSFDETVVENVYKYLAAQKYIEDFSIPDKKRLPYDVVLTQKGLQAATAFPKKRVIDYQSDVCQYFSLLVGITQLVLQIAQFK